MTVEEWRPVEGFPGYLVSDAGRVQSLRRKTPRLLSLGPNTCGYLQAFPRDADGRRSAVTVHKLVATAFLGPRPQGADIRHLNGDRRDNRLSNIQYGSRSQNVFDSVRHGTHPSARKTECKRGHEFTAENTYVPPGRPSNRHCRACAHQRHTARAFRAAGIAA